MVTGLYVSCFDPNMIFPWAINKYLPIIHYVLHETLLKVQREAKILRSKRDPEDHLIQSPTGYQNFPTIWWVVSQHS